MRKQAEIVSIKSKDAYKRAAGMIKKGGIIIVPTETVYGFAANAFNVYAQRKIYKLKKRSEKKPLVIMACDIESIKSLVEISPKALKLAERFWPGQLTLVFPSTELGKILSGGRETLGIRIPDNKFVLKLLRELTSPIWTTSVNISSKKSAKTFEETLPFLKSVDLIVDGGQCKYSFESTVIDVSQFPYVVIREGCLDKKEVLKYI
ncbi:MAG: threonylcarbamoyl-AMP synthase [Elusimicrobiota bacterium]|jgi:L-threonylcarbamoyladenylate synthase|nr:threonylcarbamoyl-AMP synthase [Elusimicrobiota bacterium]